MKSLLCAFALTFVPFMANKITGHLCMVERTQWFRAAYANLFKRHTLFHPEPTPPPVNEPPSKNRYSVPADRGTAFQKPLNGSKQRR